MVTIVVGADPFDRGDALDSASNLHEQIYDETMFAPVFMSRIVSACVSTALDWLVLNARLHLNLSNLDTTAQASDFQRATQRIFRSGKNASYIALPIETHR